MNIDASKSAGALLGTDFGLLIVKSLTYFLHVPVDQEAAGAIIGICIFFASHFLPSNPTNAGSLPAQGAKP